MECVTKRGEARAKGGAEPDEGCDEGVAVSTTLTGIFGGGNGRNGG
jgi:hypothetical protein